MARKKITFPRKYCTRDYLYCSGYNSKGQGIVHWNNKPFFVNGLLEHETARIQVFSEFADYGEARAIELSQSSIHRKLPLDHPKMELGVYHIAHLTDSAQDKFKQDQVIRLFGGLTRPIIVGNRVNYRNKVVLTNGGFRPPGWKRKHIIIPSLEQFDLMYIDFRKYAPIPGDIIIRRLNAEMSGKPGERKYVFDDFEDKIFRVQLNAFYQVNGQMARIAYKKIREFIPEQAVVFDLFAGAATIGIFISDLAKKVYSVEINKDSCSDALENIALNGITNVRIINDDANKWCSQNSLLKKPDVIIIDPSRSGVTAEAMKTINESAAMRIIYLSCNIHTQYRDIQLLKNYRTIYIQPYDFFPQTYHIENLVILEKGE